MSQNRVLFAPSVLGADFWDVSRAVRTSEQSGADWLHLDVMDGRFVPNLTFGPKFVADIRKRTKMPLDVHLMIEEPERSVDQYIDAGADRITFHVEACTHADRLAVYIRSRGVLPGISIVPSTPPVAVTDMLEAVDLVLVMTVNPGFGGQALIPRTLNKVREIRAAVGSRDLHVQVDGGINLETAGSAREAGADVLVSGSSFFGCQDPPAYARAMQSGPVSTAD